MKKPLFPILLIFAGVSVLTDCTKYAQEPKVMVAIVKIFLPHHIIPASFNIEGSVTSNVGRDVTERGICFGTQTGPTMNSTKNAEGTGIGSFADIPSGLNVNTKYYFCGYATHSAGTGYFDTNFLMI
jgi:hypothetical protein